MTHSNPRTREHANKLDMTHPNLKPTNMQTHLRIRGVISETCYTKSHELAMAQNHELDMTHTHKLANTPRTRGMVAHGIKGNEKRPE